MKKQFIIFILTFLCTLHSIEAQIERRAAFELGSGSIKILIADFDTETHHIDKYIFSDFNGNIRLSNDLESRPDGTFSPKIQQQVREVISAYKLIAEEHKVQRCGGIATEAYRKAKNGEEFINQVSKEFNFPIQIVGQEEEAKLGFLTAAEQSKQNPNDIVVWDNGAGSFQITWINNQQIQSYLGRLGKVPMKNLIITDVQGKSLKEFSSPNPISQSEAVKAKILLIQALASAPESLQIKVQNSSTMVLGIGAIHTNNIARSSGQLTYSLETVEGLLSSRFDLDDSHFDSTTPEYWVSDLIYVSSIMSHLGIQSVTNIKTFENPEISFSGNTVGILMDSKYMQ